MYASAAVADFTDADPSIIGILRGIGASAFIFFFAGG